MFCGGFTVAAPHGNSNSQLYCIHEHHTNAMKASIRELENPRLSAGKWLLCRAEQPGLGQELNDEVVKEYRPMWINSIW